MVFNTDFMEIIYSANNLEDKLKLSQYFGGVNSRFDMGLYGCEELENHLIECALNHIDLSFYKKEEQYLNENSLHVISEPYFTGGHTRLCERLSVMEEIKPDILITYNNDENYDASKKLSEYFDENYRVDRDLSMVDRVIYFIGILINYKQCILHIHQNDICAVVAVGILKKFHSIEVFFVNHADHTFSFGESIIDVKLQISNRGYLVDKLRGKANYFNSFIGIPVDIQSESLVINESVNSFVMAGTSWKMKPSAYGSAPKLVDYILKTDPDNTFVIVGSKLMDYWWWKIFLRYKKRVRFYKALPYKKYIEVIKNTDAVVDSTPGGGGTAFVEMYLLGLKPFGVSSGVGGYTPLDVVKSENIDKVLTKKVPSCLHEKIVSIHSVENVKHRYLSSLLGRYTEIPDFLTLENNDLNSFRYKGRIPFEFEFLTLFNSMNYKVKIKLLVCVSKFVSKKSLIWFFLVRYFMRVLSLNMKVFRRVKLFFNARTLFK